MPRNIKVGDTFIGPNYPVYIIAEIGLNHNGCIETAKRLIDAAVEAGCNAVKFQKRTPELCVPEDQKNIMRDTPWGIMKYIDYRHKVEFGITEYQVIADYCKVNNIHWFASCWDKPSVDFIEQFSPICYKIASASITDDSLVNYTVSMNRPIIMSTGMSTMEQISHAVSLLHAEKLLIAHCTSTYPCKPEELNLRVIQKLETKFKCPVGYSGHEVGLQTTYAAVVLGAVFVERHITLDRAMWGSDQASSVEPPGFNRLVRDIRVIEKSLGDGIKRVYESEKSILKKLRRSNK